MPAVVKTHVVKKSVERIGKVTGDSLWTRWECRLWTVILFLGTCLLYAARAALPVCATALAHEYAWNKNDAGTVLSCFFWGYACTQIFAGTLADRVGGEKVLKVNTLVWALLTYFTPRLFDLSYATKNPQLFVITTRFATGIGQAFHLPAIASITSRHLTVSDKSRIFGICLAGSHLGTALAGAVGSFLLEAFGWRVLFEFVGFLSFLWWILLRQMTHMQKRTVYTDSEKKVGELQAPLMNGHKVSSDALSSDSNDPVPWNTLVKHPAFWAAALAQYCGANAYYTMFSWLPSYFEDTFPDAKAFIYNVVPPLAIVITSFCAPFIASRIFAKYHSLTLTRRLMEGLSLFAMAFCLLLPGKPLSFISALIVFTFAMGARGLHHGGASVNPCDLAPHHTGSVFGVFNAFSSITGFVGVYIAGYVLHETDNNWSFVFLLTSMQCLIGAIIYSFFGSGNRIV